MVFAAIGSILSVCQAISGSLVGYLTDAYSDKSMMEKLYSINKMPNNGEETQK